MKVYYNLLLVVIFAVVTIRKSFGNDILGCGGFVKSHVNLDFSKIEIGLYSKAGSLKERTECAPTNGYYFLPLYEKGEYILKVHPPPGWSFEPSKVEVTVDGATDQCSTGQDVNFSFNGFGITGKVITAGQTLGPSGISVQLVNDAGEKRETVTSPGGDFHFTPVIPGKYTVKASHPRWKLDPAEAVVQVKEGNTALPVGVLAVKGYDVKGSIVSYGNPISGLYVLLYSKEESPKFRVEGCQSALLQGVPDAPICHSVTDGAGEFRFGLVPAGEYRLLALSSPPGQAGISYNLRPDHVKFTVQHDSLYIKNAFEVTGFTVVGTVSTHAGGAGVAGARVLSDGRALGTTDAAGRFTLPALQPALYTLSFQHEQYEFEDVQLSVTAAGPAQAPLARAARLRVCGAVAGAAPQARRRDVTLTAERGAAGAVRVSPNDDGKWCTFLSPGVYSARVEVSEQEHRDGLQFYPLSQRVVVAHAPVEGVQFSQLKARVSGRVRCDAPACRALQITLRPLAADGSYVGQPTTTLAKDGEYTFEEVLPGSVEVSVPTERLCWREARHNVAVTQERAAVPAFEHAGYVLRVLASHDLEVEYSSAGSRGVLSVPRGASSQCVPRAERYTLTPRGCHRFEPPQAHADTAAAALPTVELVAAAHAVVVRVVVPAPVRDLVLRVEKDGGVRDVGPLELRAHPPGGHLAEHTLYMAEGEVALVSAHSESLLFSPAAPQQVVGSAECQPDALTVRAARALTLAGRLQPPVADVLLTLTAPDGTRLTQTTTEAGTYKFGPLDASQQYSVVATRDSYAFDAPDAHGTIVAHRLAEISVELLDHADGTPLQGALVSVSGGTYRRNVASGAEGRLRFTSLSPAQYYVKPNMKEYRFEPAHHIVPVHQGRTHHITLRGVRVAWSCVGRLVSLGGVGWAGAVLTAQPDAAHHHCAVEEATTEANGVFRIRGLLPSCVYRIQLKEPSTPELSGLTLAKAPPALEVKDNKDITNVRLIAVQPHQLTDASVLVYTPNVDHYKTLRLTLSLDAAQPLYSTKLDPQGFSQSSNPGLMYTLPRLPADNRTYSLRLESSLSRSTHAYGEHAQYFASDGRYKHFTIHFLPKLKSSEQELRQTSLLVVPLLAALVLAYVRRDRLLDQVVSLWARAGARASPRGARPGAGSERERERAADALDRASIDHIVSTVNAAGRRANRKKML